MEKGYIAFVILGGIFIVVFGIPAIFFLPVLIERNILFFIMLLPFMVVIGAVLLTIGIVRIKNHPRDIEGPKKNFRFKPGREHLPLQIIGIIFILIFGIPTLFLLPRAIMSSVPIFFMLLAVALLIMTLIGGIFLSSGIFLEKNQLKISKVSIKDSPVKTHAPVAKPLTPRQKERASSYFVIIVGALIMDLIITAIIMFAVYIYSPVGILSLVVWSSMVFVGLFFACLLLMAGASSYY